MLEGSCLCGAVAYAVDAPAGRIVHCHCRTCRKAHGAAFSSVMRVPRSAFRWVRGEDGLRHFESSPGKWRRFCGACGSQIVAERPATPDILLRLGCLDTPLTAVSVGHIWRSDGACWYDPSIPLPEAADGVPAGQ